LGDEEDIQDDEEDLKSLAEKARQFAPGSDNENFDELVDDEDEEYSTAIDLIHEQIYFAEAFQAAANREPQVYQQLVNAASADDQALFKNILDTIP
jgi:hypothetical protein